MIALVHMLDQVEMVSGIQLFPLRHSQRRNRWRNFPPAVEGQFRAQSVHALQHIDTDRIMTALHLRPFPLQKTKTGLGTAKQRTQSRKSFLVCLRHTAAFCAGVAFFEPLPVLLPESHRISRGIARLPVHACHFLIQLRQFRIGADHLFDLARRLRAVKAGRMGGRCQRQHQKQQNKKDLPQAAAGRRCGGSARQAQARLLGRAAHGAGCRKRRDRVQTGKGGVQHGIPLCIGLVGSKP